MRESAYDMKIKKPGLKFNPGLALTGFRTTRPCLSSAMKIDHLKLETIHGI